MANDLFDGRKSTLKFPTIDYVVHYTTGIEGDPVIYKIDVARAFRNLRVDPVDATKFGIHWNGLYFLDQSVTFGWTHGSEAFQMVPDAVTHIMSKNGATVVAYIDDYIGIAAQHDVMCHFNHLHALLLLLGLPINQEKLCPPCKDLTCLGIRMNIHKASLSIDPEKLAAIHKKCHHQAN